MFSVLRPYVKSRDRTMGRQRRWLYLGYRSVLFPIPASRAALCRQRIAEEYLSWRVSLGPRRFFWPSPSPPTRCFHHLARRVGAAPWPEPESLDPTPWTPAPPVSERWSLVCTYQRKDPYTRLYTRVYSTLSPLGIDPAVVGVPWQRTLLWSGEVLFDASSEQAVSCGVCWWTAWQLNGLDHHDAPKIGYAFGQYGGRSCQTG